MTSVPFKTPSKCPRNGPRAIGVIESPSASSWVNEWCGCNTADSRERPAPNSTMRVSNHERQLDHRISVHCGFRCLFGSRILATQPITEMDQMGSRNRLAALRDDCGCGWHMQGPRSRCPAMSTRRVGRPYQFSRLSGLSVSSSSLQFLRSERPVLAALHGSIISRGATQDVGNIVQERGFFTQAHFAGSYLNV